MDEILRKFLFTKPKGNMEKNCTLHILVFISVTAIAVWLRYALFPYESGDYYYFLSPWSNHFIEEGFRAVADNFYDYTPLYMYLLYFCTKLPMLLLTAIKCFSVLFDFFLAIGVALIVQMYAPEGVKLRNAVIAYSLTLLLPTVFLNSAMWGQCDVMYVSFVVWSFYLLIKGKNIPAFICYGIAFSLKLQAIFFLPILLILWAADRRVKLVYFLEIPLIYFISIVPAWIAGRPLSELLTIYFRQTSAYTYSLTYKYPNIYALMNINAVAEIFGSVGICFTAGMLLLIAVMLFSKRETLLENRELLFSSILLILTVICFFLPYMHERYGYLVEIFALIYALLSPKSTILPILLCFTTTAAYFSYFTNTDVLSMAFLALLNLTALILTAYAWYRSLMQTAMNSNIC